MARPPSVVLRAPVTGWLVPLERVPDPVFAQRVVGDGVSIDPLGHVVVAPCDGQIVQLHASGHAVTLQTDDGTEVMIHIGLDTVELEGRGFSPAVHVGARVRTGDTLVEFDREYVAPRARSLLVQVVITNGARVVFVAPSGVVRAGEDPILELVRSGLTETDGPTTFVDTDDGAGSALVYRSPRVVISTAAALHVRSAAALVARARQFSSDIRVEFEHRSANAKSVVALMGLDVGPGEAVRFSAAGRDAPQAVEALVQCVEERSASYAETSSAEDPPGAYGARPEPCARPSPDARARGSESGRLRGIAASPGEVVGRIVQVRPSAAPVPEIGMGLLAEQQRLDAARRRAREELGALRARLQQSADATRAAIFAAQERLLDDPELLDLAERAMALGKSAAFAWRQAYTIHMGRLALLPTEMSWRASDLRDVGERVLAFLVGRVQPAPYPEEAVLVATDLTPSDVAELDRALVVGFCTVGGGVTSHSALLARSLGIPAIVGIDHRALEVPDGTPVILDSVQGVLTLEPSAADMDQVNQRQRQRAVRHRDELDKAALPARTHDGYAIGVLANVGSLAEVRHVTAMGAEGIGLLRSEFLFLGRATPPSEEEQFQALDAMAKALGPGQPLTIRSLDVGSDKHLPYLPLSREDNPALGERGPRSLFDRLDLWLPQIRAILRVGVSAPARAVIPMIATLDEWRAVKRLFDEGRTQLRTPAVPLGIMVEVPSMALLADQFADEVDFFSIGTNDLAQFTLAMDRSHPKLAPQLDGLHPAVLRLIAHTVDSAHRSGKRVAVCGALASDEQAIGLFIGLGVDELSVPVSAVPAVKAWIRTLVRADCEVIAERALQAATAGEVRDLLPARTEEAHLLF